MVAIAHSGGRSVVGNSEVEEHLSREAQSAVLDMQKNSQEPANYTSNKLEVSYTLLQLPFNLDRRTPVLTQFYTSLCMFFIHAGN